MMASLAITPWHWFGFIAGVLLIITLDLGLFRPGPRTVGLREALARSGLWFALAMLLGAALAHWRGREEATEFVTGYLIELSLSLDNVLVIVLIFNLLRVPSEYQRRVLTWGILGALVMRGVMIFAGAELVRNFDWMLYVFGAFLVFAGVRMCLPRKDGMDPEKNLAVRLARKCFPVTPGFAGPDFFSRLNGRLALTPLALALILIETTDLIFALDSVPAVFSVTRQGFIVFTSNVCAILSLRSLYFLIAGALDMFRFLQGGLAMVLVFVGAKMLLDPHDRPPLWFQHEISTAHSLMIIAAILLAAMALSVIAGRPEKGK